MAKAKKTPRPRASKYEDKLAINGTFSDVFQVVKKNKEQKKQEPKNDG